MDKDLLEQCREWQKKNEYSKVIEALEALPEEKRTPEIDSELARAYNNLGKDTGDRQALKKALTLLFKHAEHFKNDHLWNYRVGFAFFYLEQESRALPYFQKALELSPGDKETEELIFECHKFISLPLHSMTFAKATKVTWEEFEKEEPELLRIFEEQSFDWSTKLLWRIRDILDIAFDEISISVYRNGSKIQLILSPDGEWTKFFELAYFQSKAPESLKKNWEILVGQQPKANINGTYSNYEIKGDDIHYWLDQKDGGLLELSLYSEKLEPLHKEKPLTAEGILLRATENVIGELPRMKYIGEFNVLDAPRDDMPRPITELGKDLEALGLDLTLDPKAYLEKYHSYSLKEPKELFEGDWRSDIQSGNTNCGQLLEDYKNRYDEAVNALMADNAIPGFFCLPLNNFGEQSSHEEVLQFLHELEGTLLEKAGPDALTITGDALGNFCSYVDFIAWDFPAVMQAAVEYFKNHDLLWAGFHVFHQDAKTVIMCKAGDQGQAVASAIHPEKKQTIH